MRDLLLIAAASLITLWDLVANQMNGARAIAHLLARLGRSMFGL